MTTVDRKRLSTKCLFCDPAYHSQEHQILLRSDNFYLFAGLGAIVTGYIIIAPYRCSASGNAATSLSQLPPSMLDELAFLRGLVSAFYCETYDHPGLSFEHGRAGSCSRSHSDTLHCFHPHLCCYPGKTSDGTGYQGGYGFLWDEFSLPNRCEFAGIHSLPQAVGEFPYLYIEHHTVSIQEDKEGTLKYLEPAHQAYIVPRDDCLEPQFLRRQLSKLVGYEEAWDWEALPTPSRVDDVIADFSNWIRKEGDDWGIEVNDSSTPSIRPFASMALRTSRTYTRLVGTYEQRWRAQVQHHSVGQFLSHLSHGESCGTGDKLRVLDLGCGTGTYTRLFVECGFDVTAVDASAAMLGQAEHWLSRSELADRVTFHQARVQSILQNVSGAFDGIWFSAALLHIPRAEAAGVLNSLRSLLPSDGIIYISTRLSDKHISGFEIRREGRIFIYYEESELYSLFQSVRLKILTDWIGITKTHKSGEIRDCQWGHYILKKVE